jgi:GxxExxY protein
MTELIFKDEVFAIVGAAIEVHRELGPGFLEAVYQEAMERELSLREIPFEIQKPLQILYKDKPLKKEYITDLICYGKIIVELKSINRLTGVDEAQIINYLKATKKKVGVLINFGSFPRLEWKRFVC